MGQVYVDVKYSNDISNPSGARQSAARARVVQRTINSLLREDASSSTLIRSTML